MFERMEGFTQSSPPKVTRSLLLSMPDTVCPVQPRNTQANNLTTDGQPPPLSVTATLSASGRAVLDVLAVPMNYELATRPNSTVDSSLPTSTYSRQQEADNSDAKEQDVEGEIVEHMLDTVFAFKIPKLVENMTSKKAEYVAELAVQKRVLTENKERLHWVREQVKRSKEELASTVRKIHAAEGDCYEKQKRCDQTDAQIQKLLDKNRSAESLLHDRKLELEALSKTHESYRNKMRQHVEEVTSFESALLHSHQLQSLRSQKTTLLDEVNNLKRENSVQEVIDKTSEDELLLLDAEINSLNEKLQQLREKRAKMTQEVEVLKKRNAAQWTRMKRQLNEAQSRRQHWSSEAARLENMIASLNQLPH